MGRLVGVDVLKGMDDFAELLCCFEGASLDTVFAPGLAAAFERADLSENNPANMEPAKTSATPEG